jgi:hypothetical protein
MLSLSTFHFNQNLKFPGFKRFQQNIIGQLGKISCIAFLRPGS